MGENNDSTEEGGHRYCLQRTTAALQPRKALLDPDAAVVAQQWNVVAKKKGTTRYCDNSTTPHGTLPHRDPKSDKRGLIHLLLIEEHVTVQLS